MVDALPDGLRLVYTTPSHQYPLGGRLPVPRRQALLAWARRNDALIVEDDYDSEFRYDVAPLPALYGLGPDHTIYLGTTAKALAPGIGVGWLVARPELVEAIVQTRERLNDRTSAVPQEAVRILLESGDLDRHVRRMRAEYARRRVAVVEALGHLPLLGDTAGLHLVAGLPGGTADVVVERAAARGVLLATLDERYSGTRRACAAWSSATAAPPSRRSGRAARSYGSWFGRQHEARNTQRVRVGDRDLGHRGRPFAAGEPVGVDGPGRRVLGARHLGDAEVTAARPRPAFAAGVVRPGSGSGGPAGQRRGTRHPSSQSMIDCRCPSWPRW